MPHRPHAPSTRAACAALGRLLLPGLLLLAFAQGCRRSGPTGDVSGKVTVAGTPVQFGAIAFLTLQGRAVTVNIDQGAYRAPAVPVGRVEVTVQAIPVAANPVGHPTLGPLPPDKSRGKFIPVPSRYSLPKTSGLTYDITAGPQTKDFDLDAK